MNFFKRLGVGLVALFLIAALPALASDSQLVVHHSHSSVWLLLSALGTVGALGTVSYAYKTPGSGTVPATAAQAKLQTIQVVEVTFADADTTAPVTHNFGIGTTGASPNTGQDLPEVSVNIKTSGTAFPGLSVAWTDGNSITLGKTNTGTGSGCVAVVTIKLPHSIVGPR
jgi:hypothetical protein